VTCVRHTTTGTTTVQAIKIEGTTNFSPFFSPFSLSETIPNHKTKHNNQLTDAASNGKCCITFFFFVNHSHFRKNAKPAAATIVALLPISIIAVGAFLP